MFIEFDFLFFRLFLENSGFRYFFRFDVNGGVFLLVGLVGELGLE